MAEVHDEAMGHECVVDEQREQGHYDQHVRSQGQPRASLTYVKRGHVRATADQFDLKTGGSKSASTTRDDGITFNEIGDLDQGRERDNYVQPVRSKGKQPASLLHVASSHVHAANDSPDLKTGGSSSSRATGGAAFRHVAEFKVRLSGEHAKVPRLSQPQPRHRKRGQVTIDMNDIYEVTLSRMQEFQSKNISDMKEFNKAVTNKIRTILSEDQISELVTAQLQPLLARIAGAESDLQSFKTSAHEANERAKREQASHNAQMEATKQELAMQLESQNQKIQVVKQTQNTQMSKMREDFFTLQAFEPSTTTSSTTELGLIVKHKIDELVRVQSSNASLLQTLEQRINSMEADTHVKQKLQEHKMGIMGVKGRVDAIESMGVSHGASSTTPHPPVDVSAMINKLQAQVMELGAKHSNANSSLSTLDGKFVRMEQESTAGHQHMVSTIDDLEVRVQMRLTKLESQLGSAEDWMTNMEKDRRDKMVTQDQVSASLSPFAQRFTKVEAQVGSHEEQLTTMNRGVREKMATKDHVASTLSPLVQRITTMESQLRSHDEWLTSMERSTREKMATEEQVVTSIPPLSQRIATLESCAAKDREPMVKLERAEKETQARVSELKVSLQSLSPSLDSIKGDIASLTDGLADCSSKVGQAATRQSYDSDMCALRSQQVSLSDWVTSLGIKLSSYQAKAQETPWCSTEDAGALKAQYDTLRDEVSRMNQTLQKCEDHMGEQARSGKSVAELVSQFEDKLKSNVSQIKDKVVAVQQAHEKVKSLAEQVETMFARQNHGPDPTPWEASHQSNSSPSPLLRPSSGSGVAFGEGVKASHESNDPSPSPLLRPTSGSGVAMGVGVAEHQRDERYGLGARTASSQTHGARSTDPPAHESQSDRIRFTAYRAHNQLMDHPHTPTPQPVNNFGTSQPHPSFPSSSPFEHDASPSPAPFPQHARGGLTGTPQGSSPPFSQEPPPPGPFYGENTSFVGGAVCTHGKGKGKGKGKGIPPPPAYWWSAEPPQAAQKFLNGPSRTEYWQVGQSEYAAQSMVARHPQPVPVYDVRGVSGMGVTGDGFQQWSPSAPQDTWAPEWSGGATDAKAWEQIHWCHDEDQYFVPRLALYPPASLPEIRPTGISWGFAFLEVRPEGDIDAKMQQAAVATAAGDTRSYAIYKDRHDILDPKSQLRVQAMNSVPTYKKGGSWRVFEKALFRWFNSKGRLLPTELQLDALVATQPEAEEEKW